jgi:sugar-phosphatase
MIDAVIFDMDGLLVDSEPLWTEAMQEVFASVGVEMSAELAMKTTGLRTAEVVNYWYDYFKWQGKSKEQVAEEILASIQNKVQTEGVLMEGTSYILEFFKERKVKIGLASSSPLQFINFTLQHFGLGSYFNAVASAEHEPYGKPHPAVYLSCASQLNSEPLQCLAFEDSINGMVAAKAARMKVVVVPEKHNRENQRYALADIKLDSLFEFCETMLLELGSI